MEDRLLQEEIANGQAKSFERENPQRVFESRYRRPDAICYYKYKPPLCLKPPSKSVYKTCFELA
jgi:hypothetical protein